MATLNAMRHTGIHDPAQYASKRVAIIGVGTIGSHLALTLARMQVPITFYDADTIEEHNLATQAYPIEAIGSLKVDTLLREMGRIGAIQGDGAVAKDYDGSAITADIVVSCVDSLDARRAIANAMIENKVDIPIIDGRVGREQVEAYYFPTAKEWLAQLPDVGDEDPCGARFTAYTANIAAGLLANNVKRLLMGQELPSRIIYDAATSIFIKQ